MNMKIKIHTCLVAGLCSFSVAYADPATVVNGSNTNGLPSSTAVSVQPTMNKDQTSQADIDQIRALIQKGKLTEAKNAALEYLKLYPHDVDGQFMLGVIYYKQKDFLNAANVLSDGLKNHPNYTDVRIMLIHTDLRLNRYSDALAIVNEGLKIDPKNEELLHAKIQATKAMQFHK